MGYGLEYSRIQENFNRKYGVGYNIPKILSYSLSCSFFGNLYSFGRWDTEDAILRERVRSASLMLPLVPNYPFSHWTPPGWFILWLSSLLHLLTCSCCSSFWRRLFFHFSAQEARALSLLVHFSARVLFIKYWSCNRKRFTSNSSEVYWHRMIV